MIPDSLDPPGSREDAGLRWSASRTARLASYAAVALCLVNALLALLQCGPGQCPDNPTGYWAFGGGSLG